MQNHSEAAKQFNRLLWKRLCPKASHRHIVRRNGRIPGGLGTCDSLNCKTGFCTTSSKPSGALCCCFFYKYCYFEYVKHLVCVSATEIVVPINVKTILKSKGEQKWVQFHSLKVVCAENAQILSYVLYISWPLFSEWADCCFKVNFFVSFIHSLSYPFSCEILYWVVLAFKL